jgi:hypothetical protein
MYIFRIYSMRATCTANRTLLNLIAIIIFCKLSWYPFIYALEHVSDILVLTACFKRILSFSFFLQFPYLSRLTFFTYVPTNLKALYYNNKIIIITHILMNTVFIEANSDDSPFKVIEYVSVMIQVWYSLRLLPDSRHSHKKARIGNRVYM